MTPNIPRFARSAAVVVSFLAAVARADGPPPGIVLVIADGTSQELITAARIYAKGVQGRLELESFPQTAIVRTFSASDVVTDSGAAATAMARGIKADNRVVGIENSAARSGPPSLLDLARKAGWSTGVVTDDSVTGATPASFLVEHPDRNQNALIAGKIVAALGPRADLVLGGGTQWFSDEASAPDVVYAPTDPALVRANAARLAASGTAYFRDWSAFVAHGQSGYSARPVLGTFYPDRFPFYADGTRTLRVADLATEAVRFLRARGRPFFLMVEASLPDKACHLGQAKRAIVEVLELDAMLAALRREVPAGSLILVTSDHNNGGLTINGPPVPLSTRGDALLGPNLITGAAGILTWATGPGFDQKTANLRAPVGAAPAEVKLPSDPDYNQPAALPAAAAQHTGGDVWLLREGPGSEAVHGYLDNTDVFRLIARQIRPRSGSKK